VAAPASIGMDGLSPPSGDPFGIAIPTDCWVHRGRLMPVAALGTRIKKGSRRTQGSLRALLILTSRPGSLVDVLT
jgi:hypothetical protein